MIKYPYSDFHEMNLNWLLEQVKNLDTKTDDFVEEVQEVKEAAEGIPKIKSKIVSAPSRVLIESADSNCFFIVITARYGGGQPHIQTVPRFNGTSVDGNYISSDISAPVATWDSVGNRWYLNVSAATYVFIIPLLGDVDFVS